jgi:hypothetical protein
MSEPSPSAPGKAGPPKKQVSPARNAISLVVLVAVVVIGYFEVTAKMGYRAAADALDKRLQEEDRGLPSQEEAEKLIGKPADDAGGEVVESNRALTKKTYTWHGLISHYPLVAYYTKGTPPALFQYEAGEKVQHEVNAPPAVTDQSSGPQPKTAPKGKGAGAKGSPKPKGEEKPPAADETKAPEPAEKAPEPKPDDKSKAAPAAAGNSQPAGSPEPKPDDKPKAAADEKPKTE